MMEIANQDVILSHVIESERYQVSNFLDFAVHVIEAAEGYNAVKRAVALDGMTLKIENDSYDLSIYEHVFVIGFGKAAEPMAEAVNAIMKGFVTEGVLLVKEGTTKRKFIGRIRVLEGGHPSPTYTGYRNAQKVTKFIRDLPKKRSLFIVLISGGGSSLYGDFFPGLEFKDGVDLNDVLVSTSASIPEINTVRKHTAEIKGGNLAQLLEGATTISLVISDVPDNDLSVVASGPLAPDVSTFGDAKTVLDTYGLWDRVPESVRARILGGIAGRIPETPKPGHPCFSQVRSYIVADALTSCEAVAKRIKEVYGHCPVRVYPAVMKGPVTDALAIDLLESPPGFTVLGHEYTYGADPSKRGEGGRQLQLLLLMVKHMKKSPEYENRFVLGIATDGKDGNSFAGAVITPSLVAHARIEEIERAEKEENSGKFFKEKGTIIRVRSEYGLDTTGTNVNNVMVIYNPAQSEKT
jgi:glycerate 2-kinase